MNLSLNQALHQRVTMYATEAEERTGETIYYAVLHFLEAPARERRLPGGTVMPVAPGACTRGERAPVDHPFAAPEVARIDALGQRLGLSRETVLDLAVERACPPWADLWCAEWSDSGQGA